jgi:pyrimidine deaminase RibD-like protein
MSMDTMHAEALALDERAERTDEVIEFTCDGCEHEGNAETCDSSDPDVCPFHLFYLLRRAR